MRIEVNKGIAYNQCASGLVEVGGFAFASPRQRDGVELGRMGGEMGGERVEEGLAVPIVVGVSFDNLNDPTWHGSILGPINGIKKDGQLFAEVGGGPEFSLTGRVVDVPSGKT
jgi:hypothetical protein